MNRLISYTAAVMLGLMAAVSARAQEVRITTACTCSDLYDANGKLLPKPQRSKTLLVNGTRISSGFGMRIHPIFGYSAMHWGVDVAAPSGAPIYATSAGIIQDAGPKGGYGNYVLVRHSRAYATGYAHASLFAPGIYPGAHVKRGQVLAYVGSTGLSTGPHLHYEIFVNGWPIKPACGCTLYIDR
jgi:murein DD-endopeptidase MepM/ murein hydrolase activator NlpD